MIRNDQVPRLVHHTRHEDGGADEPSIAGLSGVAADAQVADKLKKSGGTVAIDSTAPSADQVLTATSSSAASWQAPKQWNRTAKSSDYTAVNRDFVAVTGGASNVTITLPSPTAGHMVAVQCVVAPDPGTSVAVAGTLAESNISALFLNARDTFVFMGDGSAWQTINRYQACNPATNGFRLTGVSGEPLMTSDSTSLTTIYLTPYKGNVIALHNGICWELVTSPEVSYALSGTTSDLPFDIFAVHSGSSVTLEALDWLNPVTRNTARVYQDGVLVKSGDPTRRYVGTCRARVGQTFCFVQAGVNAPARFDLFNEDNQIEFGWSVVDTADNWSASPGWQQGHGVGYNQVELMSGSAGAMLSAHLVATGNMSTGGGDSAVAFGVNSYSVPSGTRFMQLSGVGGLSTFVAHISQNLPLGCNVVVWLEWGSGSGNWYGDAGDSNSRMQSGMTGTWRC